MHKLFTFFIYFILLPTLCAAADTTNSTRNIRKRFCIQKVTEMSFDQRFDSATNTSYFSKKQTLHFVKCPTRRSLHGPSPSSSASLLH